MKHRLLIYKLPLVISMVMLLCIPVIASPQPNPSSTTTMTATGSFNITLTPQTDDGFESGRMTIDKVYSGELEGTGKGQMLSLRTAVAGSASYVALETVHGTVGDRTGSFTLQHNGSMIRGESKLQVNIVPDSGTEELKGISGTMEIDKVDEKHNYTLTYSITEQPE